LKHDGSAVTASLGSLLSSNDAIASSALASIALGDGISTPGSERMSPHLIGIVNEL
jgi:hypothetical protein